MNDDAQSGIHFFVTRGSKRGKKDEALGSSNSMASLQQTPMTRANSVTSMLKRLFSKEDQRQPSAPVANQTDGGKFENVTSHFQPTCQKCEGSRFGWFFSVYHRYFLNEHFLNL